MSEEPYTMRELDSKFERVCDLITEKCGDLGKTLSEVKTQTTLTNGRVTKLETIEAERRGGIKWVLGVGAFICSAVLAYLSWVGIKINETQVQITQIRAETPGMIQDTVSKALLPYAH